MRKTFLLATITVLAALTLTACGGGSAAQTPEEAALAFAAEDGLEGATITDTAEGDPITVGADAVYCIATDATDAVSGLPYLVVVAQTGDDLTASQMTEGFYEWDLYGCPR